MTQLQDYYKTLQVHPQAELEVIEAAYKRLAKKYHPDVAKAGVGEGDLTMQLINEAYEVLKDANRRQTYHEAWQKAFAKVPVDGGSQQRVPAALQQAVLLAQAVLTKYFEAIQGERYEVAYQLLCGKDRRLIRLELFTRWQQSVRRIFALQNFSVQPGIVEMPHATAPISEGMSLRFIIMTVDYNCLMERLEQDAFERRVRKEGRSWSVCLDNDNIEGAIARYAELITLLETRTTMKVYVDSYSKHDSVTGIYNKRGIIELIEREGLRHSRYGRRFSLLMLGVAPVKAGDAKYLEGTSDHVANALVRSLRELDSIGRWQEHVFVVMMPETDLRGALLAAQKLRRQLNRLFKNTKQGERIAFPCAVDVYPGTLALAIDRLDYLYDASLKHPKRAIFSLRGPLET